MYSKINQIIQLKHILYIKKKKTDILMIQYLSLNSTPPFSFFIRKIFSAFFESYNVPFDTHVILFL